MKEGQEVKWKETEKEREREREGEKGREKVTTRERNF